MTNSKSRPLIYFSSLELENVRCFGERQVLQLADDQGQPVQWTLLLGDNGIGKTTLLQCLAWMRPVPYFGTGEEDTPKEIQPALTDEENDVLASLLRAGSEVTLELKASVTIGRSLPGDDTVQSVREPRGRSIETGISMEGEDGRLQELKTYRVADENNDIALIEPPLFAYGAARHMGKSNLDNKELADPLASLFSSAIELYDAEERLLELDYLRLIDKKHEERLQKIKEVFAAVLPDISGPDDVKILGPKARDHFGESGGVWFTTPYGDVPLSGLSLGYQTTLAWVLDLAIRLNERYPESENPLAEPAIVLVDEIDLHLHPRWQRQIVADLTQHFPKTQFIVTAHSPLMVQSAANANLVVLQEEGGQVKIENQPHFIEGWRADQILTSDLFGIHSRSPRIEKLINERYDLPDKTERTPEEEQRLRELDEELDNLPTGSHEDNEAMEIIRKAAVLIKERNSQEP